MKIIWATRGRTWGFRFLRNGGFPDPLPVYNAVFAGVENESEIWRHVTENGALRFPDPQGRKDVAGRVISHDFVVFPSLANEIDSPEEGRRCVWPLVADRFADVWNQREPPSAEG